MNLARPGSHPLHDSPAWFAEAVLGLDLYQWQVDALEDIGRGVMNGRPPTSLVAANGSGKTQRVIAAAILWFLWRYPKGLCPVTSGSWTQVEKQLFPALHSFQHLPIFRGWTFNQTEVRTPTGALCFGFSTDSPGRAEGHHTRGNIDEGPVFYVVDEAKTVSDGIFDAVGRCTLRYCLFASSPGGPSGKFYRTHHEERGMHLCVRATSADCPHISVEKIERDRAIYGEDHPVFRSMHKAEFSEGSELLIIQPDLVAAAMLSTQGDCAIPESSDGYRDDCSAFLDFAAGRDENTLTLTDGTNVWMPAAWHETDTVQGARQCIANLKAAGIRDASQVWGDADGLGIGFVDQMAEMGWHINQWRGGNPAIDEEHYCSKISEAWFEQGRKVARGHVKLCGQLARSPATIRQLTTRMSEWNEKGKLRAEPKEKMAKRGLKSPDRGDGIVCVLACHNDFGGAITSRNLGGVITAPATQHASGFAQVVRW